MNPPHSFNRQSTTITVTNATAILATEIIDDATIHIEDGVITSVAQSSVESAPQHHAVYNARGAYVMPGIVDLHNDNLEHEINPRAKANLPVAFALSNMERRLAASGVTTEFHSISFQDRESKGRSIVDARAKAEFVHQFEDDPRHGVRHHILHRLDVRTENSIEQAMPTLMDAQYPYASLNDHTPGQGQYRDVERLIQIAHEQAEKRNGQKADPEWYFERMRHALADTETVPAFYRKVAGLKDSIDLHLATHDDDTLQKVEEQLALGARIAEFPVTFEAAEFSRENGLAIVVGAPNIVRGGSQSGNLSAMDLVARDLADIICADYHSPSMLPAAWKLADQGRLSLPAAVAMLTANPANAVGMNDRGVIEAGKLGDLCIVRVDESGWPHCEATIVGGVVAFSYPLNTSARFQRVPAEIGAATGA